MTRNIRRWVGLGMLLVSTELVVAKSPNHPIQLFDGVSLKGWTGGANGESVTKNWSVENGMLVLNGVGGSIYTADEYGDLDLSFQWKIAPHGNSGVKYRVDYYKKGVFGKPGWLGCEYQLFDDPSPKSTTRYSTGAIYDLYPPARERSLRTVGEFNDSRIVVRGSEIQHWLNGTKIVAADMNSEDWKRKIAASKFANVKGFMNNPKGRIQLQDHRSQVWFRNIVLIPLDSSR